MPRATTPSAYPLKREPDGQMLPATLLASTMPDGAGRCRIMPLGAACCRSVTIRDDCRAKYPSEKLQRGTWIFVTTSVSTITCNRQKARRPSGA